MIDFEHVSKTYETHNDENVALEDINIHIDEGEFVFILGHSGAGKSTFLKLIQMEEKPTEGKVFINGQDLTRIKRRKVPYLRRQMGVVFQDFRLIPTMTVYENVAFAMRVTNISTKKIKARVPFALSLVGLEDKMTACPMSFPAASSSVWRWPAPWPTAPRSSSRTSPPATSTRKCRWISCSCLRPSTRSTSRWWSLPTSTSWSTSWRPNTTTASSHWRTVWWHPIPPTRRWRVAMPPRWQPAAARNTTTK